MHCTRHRRSSISSVARDDDGDVNNHANRVTPPAGYIYTVRHHHDPSSSTSPDLVIDLQPPDPKTSSVQPSGFSVSAMNAIEVGCAGGMNAAAAVFGRRRLAGHCRVIRAAATVASGGACSESRRDYYKVLSLERPEEVGAEEIRRAYRRLALRYHPDTCPPSRRAESTQLFLELRRAYETLSDPALRVRYDAELLRRTTAGDAPPRAADDALARDVWEAQLHTLRARSDERRQGAGRSRRGRWFEV